jgi:membrane fusion protein (multidrug efflux system)
MFKLKNKLTTPILILIGALFFTNSYSANQQFPPSLSSTPGNINTTTTSSDSKVSTPEYVIIRSIDETTFSSETTGKIINLPIKEGSIFEKGVTLLSLDCRLQEADLKKAVAEQAASNKALESAKKLESYGSISEYELVKAKSEAEGANADVDKLSVIVEKCKIIAPFNGAVAEVMVHLYETVKPSDPLLKVVNIENLTFELQIPSPWLSWLHLGSNFKVHINDINKTVSAKVTLINPEIEPISQTVKIIGIIYPPNPALRPGMSGQAIFPDNPIKK